MLTPRAGLTVDDLPLTTKKAEAQAVRSTFVIAVKPTSKQKKAMTFHLRVAQTTYNWCKWLVERMGFNPSCRTCRNTSRKIPWNWDKPGKTYLWNLWMCVTCQSGLNGSWGQRPLKPSCWLPTTLLQHTKQCWRKLPEGICLASWKTWWEQTFLPDRSAFRNKI